MLSCASRTSCMHLYNLDSFPYIANYQHHFLGIEISTEAGSSSKNMNIGDGLGTQMLGSALLSKDQDQAMDLGEVVKEAVDPKGKASMPQHHGMHHQNHHGFPFHSSSAGSCFPQTQAVSGDTTSNIAQVQEPSLAFHHQHHQHSNILQLGQAMFDLDFEH